MEELGDIRRAMMRCFCRRAQIGYSGGFCIHVVARVGGSLEYETFYAGQMPHLSEANLGCGSSVICSLESLLALAS